MRNMRQMFYIAFVGIGCCLVGCGKSLPVAGDVHRTIRIGSELPPFDVRLNWSHYEYQRDFDKSEVGYFWNGELIGHGAEGFNRAIDRIRVMSPGDIVLLYPSLPYNMKMWPAQPHHDYPFIDEFDDLEGVAQESQVWLYWSEKDHLGRALGPDGPVPTQSQ